MPRVLTGVVVSDKGDKTIVISVAARKKHPLYRKRYTMNTKFMAHDEANSAKVGDKVAILESRPISARKRFVLDKIIEKAHAGFMEADATADVPMEEPVSEEVKEVKTPREKIVKKAKESLDKPQKDAK